MNAIFKLQNLIRCCPNCVCATKIEKSIARIPLNKIEKKGFKCYKSLDEGIIELKKIYKINGYEKIKNNY